VCTHTRVINIILLFISRVRVSILPLLLQTIKASSHLLIKRAKTTTTCIHTHTRTQTHTHATHNSMSAADDEHEHTETLTHLHTRSHHDDPSYNIRCVHLRSTEDIHAAILLGVGLEDGDVLIYSSTPLSTHTHTQYTPFNLLFSYASTHTPIEFDP